MEDAFLCSICLEVAEKAVETSCCHHVFCEVCLTQLLGRECPQCRGHFQILVSHVSRRIIGNMPVVCIYKKCGKSLTRSSAKDHEQTCEFRVYQCPATECGFDGEKKSFMEHLFNEHADDIARNAHLCFPRSETSSPSNTNTSHDPVARKQNSSGRWARLGETGKYYCQGSLGTACDCCDGDCGPGNGCNCRSCMELDVAARKLPRNYYVNREGAICRKSPETELYYCGRKNMPDDHMCDGWCGPTNGPHCRACQIMQYQVDSRYAEVW